jgi:hypothetical protein
MQPISILINSRRALRLLSGIGRKTEDICEGHP